MNQESTAANRGFSFGLLGSVAFFLLALVSIGPLLLEPRPVRFIAASTPGPLSLPALLARSAEPSALKVLAVCLLALPIGLRIRADRRNDPNAPNIGLVSVLLAGLMTLLHVSIVESQYEPSLVLDDRHYETLELYPRLEWQQYLYLATFNGWTKANLVNVVPHIYRPLPCGFVRTFERLTGDWLFACLVYRWFFNFWFIWAFYRFVRLFHSAERSTLALVALLLLYPLSIWNYWGQLTDAMSHALFALALIYIVEDAWLGLLVSVFLGVLAKETAVILVPAYCACYWRNWRSSLWLWKGGALGLVGVVAFLSARIPVGWRPGSGLIHSLPGLMITSNLGIGTPAAVSEVPLYQNYLHPFLFVGIFLPFIAWHWRQTDARLKALFLTLTPLVLGTSLCFSWLYESRNYVPLLPVLTAMCFSKKPDVRGHSA
jgi:hypothetical protein